jgi:hypothetical protein
MMNLNNQPTIDELARMFAAKKDSHDSHILWISKSGQVHIDCLSPHAGEEEFDRNHQNLLTAAATVMSARRLRPTRTSLEVCCRR